MKGCRRSAFYATPRQSRSRFIRRPRLGGFYGWEVPSIVSPQISNVLAAAESLSADSGKVRYFEGTPIPTSVLLTALLAFAAWQGRIGAGLYGGAIALGPWLLHPLALLFVLSGSLMISKTLRIPKF